MNLKRIEQLNNILQPLHRKFKELKLILKDYDFNYYNAGWYNMHSIKYNDDFIEEYFPIPVISVEGVGDIGINLDHIFIETRISKEKVELLQLDYFTDYNIEIYGVEDYLMDYYHPNIEKEIYKEKLYKSSEKEFHFTINLLWDMDLDEIINFIFKLKNWEII